MIARMALLLGLVSSSVFAGVAEDASKASSELQLAVQALDQATTSKDRISALTRTIRAYETGIAALREALRQAALREEQLTLSFQAKRDSIAQLLGVLGQLDAEPGPLLLLHPTGPLGTARSGMLLADVTPGLQAQAEVVRSQLLELNDLRSLQAEASKTLTKGLDVAIAARSALSQAISNRTELPKKLTEDPEVLRGLLESADTLEAFAAGLVLEADASSGFADAKGNLALPVLGKLVLLAGETDAYGVTRPGLSFATRAGALVQNPWPATIRYSGPLLDYGNVMILEPGEGYLLIVAGLDQVYGTVGEVIAKGAPLGLMGGSEQGLADISASQGKSGVLSETQTLYLELRQGSKAIDPIDWFAATATAEE